MPGNELEILTDIKLFYKFTQPKTNNNISNRKRYMPSKNKDYTRQINNVIDYIHQHLDKQITIEELSARICLSPFHFHRIFTAAIGEPLGKYISRKRLEKAANMLVNPELMVKDIAYGCGYSSTALLCRSFKRHFGLTTEEFRSKHYHQNSKDSQFKSINEQHTSLYSRYFYSDKKIKSGGKIMNCTFEIKELAPVKIIYCRHQGALDQMQGAFARLMQWAYPRGLVGIPDMKLLSVYHDDPRVTEKDKLTADAAMTVNSDIKTDGEIGSYTLTGGKYAVGRFEIAMQEFPAAWEAMFALLAENGCQCSDGHHYEVYLNNHDEHPEKKFIVDICIPVKPL